MLIIQILLGIIAVGVLLITKEGKRILNWGSIALMVFGVLYWGYWGVGFVWGLITSMQAKTAPTPSTPTPRDPGGEWLGNKMSILAQYLVESHPVLTAITVSIVCIIGIAFMIWLFRASTKEKQK